MEEDITKPQNQTTNNQVDYDEGNIQTLTGLDERTVRRMIWRERLGGACICMDCRSGYYLAATAAERDRCARSMEHRAAEIYRTAQAIASAEVAGDG